MQPKDKGILVEATFKLRALQQGWVVSQPFGDNAPYDFIVDTGNELLKVQCKYLKSYRGIYRLQTCSRVGAKRLGSLSYKGRVDRIYGFNLEDKTEVWVGPENFNGTEISFRPEQSFTGTSNLVEDFKLGL